MIRRIIWVLLETSFIGGGTYIFISTILNEDILEHKTAGLGAFLIVLGLLIRDWRLTLFIDSSNEKKETDLSKIKTSSVLAVMIFALSIFLLHRKVTSTIENLEYGNDNVEVIATELYRIEDRVSNVEDFEERIIEIENYSHSHY